MHSIWQVVLSTKHENYRDLFKELEAKHKPLLPTSFCFDMKLFLDKMLFPNNSVMAEVQKDKVDDPDDPFFMTVRRQLKFFPFINSIKLKSFQFLIISRNCITTNQSIALQTATEILNAITVLKKSSWLVTTDQPFVSKRRIVSKM